MSIEIPEYVCVGKVVQCGEVWSVTWGCGDWGRNVDVVYVKRVFMYL